MLFLVSASWLLGVLVITAGRDLTSQVSSVAKMDTPDRTFLQFWCGTAILFAALCLFSLAAPLQHFAWLALLYLLLRHRVAWRLSRDVLKAAGWRWILALVLSQLAYAIKMVELTSNFDSYLYHYQIIGWYGEYGAVKGLGLLHFRLAFSSAWYALAAAFETGPLTGRGGNLPSFFLLSAGTAFSLAVARRAYTHSLTTAARFWLFFFAGVLASMPVEVHSTSADYGAAVLIGAAVWAVLAAPGTALRSVSYGALPVLIAAAAAAMKQQAAFAFAGLGLFVLLRTWTGWRSLFWLSLACVPFAAASAINIITSGCLLNNVGASCLDLPWAMSKWQMRDSAAAVLSFYRFLPINGAHTGTDFGTWAPAWLSRERCYVALSAMTLLAAVVLEFRPKRTPGAPDRGVLLTIFGIALAGILGCFWSAPTLRFAVGYLWLMPALAFAMAGNLGTLLCALAISVVREWLPFGTGGHAPLAEYLALPLLVGVLIAVLGTKRRDQAGSLAAAALLVIFVSPLPDIYRRPITARPNGEAGVRWLLPVHAPELEASELQFVIRPGFRMYQTKPPNNQCFAGNLPCSLYDGGLVLLSPDDGIGGGFTYGPDSPRYGERERSLHSN